MTHIEQGLIHLYTSLKGAAPLSISKLPSSGSYRSYYRIHGSAETVIGAHNEDSLENEAFISFTNHFRREGLPVPEILASDPANRIYLLTDLGDTTLYQFLTENRISGPADRKSSRQHELHTPFPEPVLEVYKKALGWLIEFQVKAGKGLDYAMCHPRAAFDRQSMMWDLNYFKYYFLKLAQIPFEEQALEDDFNSLCDFLLEADADFFLYRDFQSRNIMLVGGEPWFIDYQGGRKGALQYDVASLLYDGKADLPQEVRDELLQFYMNRLLELYPVDADLFLRQFDAFTLIRILQALGAYGFRGYYEKKAHFLQSIPFALKNLQFLRKEKRIDFGLKTLMSVIDLMVENEILFDKPLVKIDGDNLFETRIIKDVIEPDCSPDKLTIAIHSFSYKKSIPTDDSGNGGGFVFDCRALPNPGRFDEFKQLNGKDQTVIDYLTREKAVGEFLHHAFALVDQSVQTYLARDFHHLMVSFGCTGGQHRSVFCAQSLAQYLKTKYRITIILTHLENPQLNT